MFSRFIGLILICSSVAHASERPDWTSSTPKTDAVYKYYVGRAIEEANEKDAWRIAKDQAQETAIRENFGVETSIASSSYESADKVTLDKRISELFPKVRLVDFEQIDSFVENEDGRVSVWILFRYPLKQIGIENERLRAVGPVAPTQFNVVGRPELNYSTVLEVTSEPLGVPVFIDSERWGVTPLRVSGVLATGVHKVKLSHDNYQDVEGDVVLTKGAVRRVHNQLMPAMGYLRFNVMPRNAEVIVDGVSKGKAPSNIIQVLVGRPIKVEARSAGFETQIQMIEVQKNEVRRVEFELNEIKRNLASIEEGAQSSAQYKMDNGDWYQHAWIFGLLLGSLERNAPKEYGLSMAQFGFTVEKRFWWYFGLRGGLSYDFATEDTKTSESSQDFAMSGTGSFIGLPIYFTSSPSGVYLMPEVGKVKYKRMVEQDNPYSYSYEPEFIEMSASRKGIRIGYMNIESHVDVWLAVHEYDWRDQGTVQSTSVGITFTFNDGGK